MKFPTEYGSLNLDYNPAKYAVVEEAAVAFHKAICALAKKMGYDPDTEIWIKNPAESAAHGYVNAWHVVWESGPFEWGCEIFVYGSWGHCETYWGFDLAFYEAY